MIQYDTEISMDNEAMDILNFKLSLVSGIVGKWINYVPRPPKEFRHKFVRICMNKT